MGIVSDRTIRSYRQHLREGKSFHIQLKTKEGLVDIRVDEDFQAMMLNKDTAKYDLPLGHGAQVVDLIEKGELIPKLEVWWKIEEDETSVEASGEVLKPGPGYQVLSQLPETTVETAKQLEPVQEQALVPVPEQASAQGPESEEHKEEEEPVRLPSVPVVRAKQRIASSVLRLIEAYKSGKRKFRMWDDSLKERTDGKLAWEFGIYRQVDGRMKTIGTVTVALFTPNGIEFPAEGQQYRAVVARRALLTSESKK